MIRVARRVVAAGVVAAAIGGAGVVASAAIDVRRALLAWLAAFGSAVATVVAALVLVMVLHVTRARWSVVIRPVLDAVVGTMPVLVVLFVPIALGIHVLYPWAVPTLVDASSLPDDVARALDHQRTWNSPPFFLVRSAVYLGTWSTLVLLLRRADAIYERAPTSELPERFEAQRRVSGVGLPIMAITITFAAFDWLMAIEPGWVSTAFGVYVFCGGLVSAVSVVAIGTWLARRGDVLAGEPSRAHVHAIGRLMLMSVVLWAYIGFFQLLLVWIADVPRESSFYGARARGAWSAVDVLLVVGHFAAPFLVLLSRPLKRSPFALAVVGAWLVAMNALDFAWIVLPQAGGPALRLLDVAPFLVVYGLSSAFAAHRAAVRARATSPIDAEVDPVLRDSLRYRSP